MDDFDRTLPMILNRALDVVLPPFREIFAAHDLTEQQWRVLRVLWQRQSVTGAELSRACLIPAPSLVGVLDRLEKRGFVARTRSQTDRRMVHLTPTKQGMALAQDVLPKVEEIHARIRASVSDKDWAHMVKTLERAAMAASATKDTNAQAHV